MGRSIKAVVAWVCGVAALSGLHAGTGRAQEVPDTLVTQVADLRVEMVLTGLEAPVAMAFLPDGRAILAQRAGGTFGIVDVEARTLTPLGGLPEMLVEGDGGPLDVVLHPDYVANGWIYLAYSEVADGGSVTVMDRARLRDGAFVDRQRVFTAGPPEVEHAHYGGRIAFHQGYVYLSIGDRHPRPVPGRRTAQSLATHAGTIVRLEDDGSVPRDNPFVGVAEARPEIWSYGHRNPQGLAVNPATGSLWDHEHGPQGGDEVNVIQRGGNYGWPVITYGEEYGGGPVGDGQARRDGMLQPIHFYRPSIAPSDMVFVSGRNIEAWRGSVLIGAMGLTHLNRLTLDGDRVLHEERLLEGLGLRVRMIEEAPDGRIYLGTDSGLLLRLTAANR